MSPNACGEIVIEEWQRTPLLRPYVILDVYVLMPNHFHGLIVIDRPAVDVTLPLSSTLKSASLGSVMGQFKSAVTKRFQLLETVPEFPIWQRNYYEHIIRDEHDEHRIRGYIASNPEHWKQDSLFIS